MKHWVYGKIFSQQQYNYLYKTLLQNKQKYEIGNDSKSILTVNRYPTNSPTQLQCEVPVSVMEFFMRKSVFESGHDWKHR